MTDRTPPAIELPQPNPAYVAGLAADLNAVYERGLAELRTANREARAKNERAALSIAQHAGADTAQMVKLAGGTVEMQADAYHASYIKQARVDGLATVCHCQNCGKA